jgi:hypothetical protein
MLWIGYDATREQGELAKKQFSSYARPYPLIKAWCDLPGAGMIRATTIVAYLDTPWRFENRARLHRDCGVGLVRMTSGTEKKGRPKPARLKLPWAVNRRIKNAVMGAAIRAIEKGDNAFKDYYERMRSHGITPVNARDSVARKLVSTISAMWKPGRPYDETLVEHDILDRDCSACGRMHYRYDIQETFNALSSFSSMRLRSRGAPFQ